MLATAAGALAAANGSDRRRSRSAFDLASPKSHGGNGGGGGAASPQATAAAADTAASNLLDGGGSDDDVSRAFPEVPAGETTVEKLRCMLGTRVGTLHITRNYLCWGGRGGRRLVLHFGEITNLEKTSKFLDSIEVQAVRGGGSAAAVAAAAAAAAAECARPATDLLSGSAVAAAAASQPCSKCGSPCAPRGCTRCNAVLCPRCFDAHRAAAAAAAEDAAANAAAAAAEAPQETAKETLRPVDLDRVYSMLVALWKAHLRIPVSERIGRPSPSASPSSRDGSGGAAGAAGGGGGGGAASSDGGAGGGAGDKPFDKAAAFLSHHGSDADDVLAKKVDYAGSLVEAGHFSAPDIVREGQKGDAALFPDTTLAQVFASLIEDTVGFTTKYHISRSDETVACRAWQHPGGDRACGVRHITYVAKTPVGKRPVNCSHRYTWTAQRLSLQTSSQAPGVTFGSSFRTETIHDFTVDASGGGVRLANACNVMFISSPGLLKGTIKKTALKACMDSFPIFVRHAKIGFREMLRRAQGAAGGAGSGAAGGAGGGAVAAADTYGDEDDDSGLAGAAGEGRGGAEAGGPQAREAAAVQQVLRVAIVLFCATVMTGVLVCVSPVDSSAIQALPQLAAAPAEISYQSSRVLREGTKHHVSAAKMLASAGIPDEAAVPILYELLEREVTRFFWVRWLATLSFLMVTVIAAASLVAYYL